MGAEVFLLGREVGGGEGGGVPPADEPEVVAAEGVGECGGCAWVSVAEFTAGVTGGAHLAQDCVERDVAGEFVEVVVAPDDRIGADEAVAVERGG